MSAVAANQNDSPVITNKSIFEKLPVRTLGILAGVFSAITWGLDTTFLNKSYEYYPMNGDFSSITIGAVSTMVHDVFSSVFVLCAAIALMKWKETKAAFQTKGLFWMILASIFGAPIGMLGYLLAIDNLGSAYTSAISALYPAVGAFLAFVFLRERLFAVGWIGMALAVVGTICISLNAIFSDDNVVTEAGLGIVFALMCVIGWGTECVIADYSFRYYDMDTTVALLIRQLTSVFVYNVIVLPINGSVSYDFTRDLFESSSIWWLLGAGLLGGSSYIAYYYAIAVLGATQAIGLNITYTIWTVIFSLFFKIYPESAVVIIFCILAICIGSFMCAGLGKEVRPWILLKSWVNKATEAELEEMKVAEAEYQASRTLKTAFEIAAEKNAKNADDSETTSVEGGAVVAQTDVNTTI